MFSAGTLPVLVRVCHWCCTRPVFSTMGYSASGSSAAGNQGRAKKRALPLAVGKANTGHLPWASRNSVWLLPSLR
ncbi:hypothetical protein D3C71_1987860 [compost metagenome]